MSTSEMHLTGLAGVAKAVLAARSAGREAVAGRVVDIQGFSTWAGDEIVVVDDRGIQHGWVLGEVGGRKVRAAASELLGRSEQGLTSLEVEVHGAAVAEAGLSCGGRAELLLQPAAGIPARLWQSLAERAPVALLTRIDGEGRSPQSMVVETDGTMAGALDGADEAVEEAVSLLRNGHSATRRVESPLGTVLVEAWVPMPRPVVVGAGDLVIAIVAQSALLGWDTVAVEDRPDGEEEPDAWPTFDDALAWAGGSAALVVLSHDPHVDVPAISKALDQGVPYIGAMGSRRTQSRRVERLQALGRTEQELATIHRPIGLDLGGRSAPEVALAICAEILAVHCGRDARPLKDHQGPIRERPRG
jgi:xanthine dehydrogenase accessory factor